MQIAYPPELLKELTRLWEGERFANGRPRVSDDLVERMKLVTTEEAWGTMRRNGYTLQFEGGWINTHPDRVLVGRAVTAAFVPRRQDFHDLIEETGRAVQILKDLLAAGDLSVLLVEHDMEVVFELADNITVLHRGRVIESGPADAFFCAPSSADARRFIAGELLV